eukprot:scaffold105399_cov31-Tisochrysis_lutea.AAC.4
MRALRSRLGARHALQESGQKDMSNMLLRRGPGAQNWHVVRRSSHQWVEGCSAAVDPPRCALSPLPRAPVKHDALASQTWHSRHQAVAVWRSQKSRRTLHEQSH